MVSWKILLVVLLGVALLAGGVITELGEGIGGFDVGDFVNRITGNILADPGERDIIVSGNFETVPFDLNNIPIERIRIQYNPAAQNSDFYVSGERLVTVSLTTVEIDDYKGTLRFNNSFLTLNGNAQKVTINGVGLETIKSSVPVKATPLRIEEALVKNLDTSKLEIRNLKGDITIQKNVNVKLNYEPMTLESFLGNVRVSSTEGLKIDGEVKKVLISGRDYGATVS